MVGGNFRWEPASRCQIPDRDLARRFGVRKDRNVTGTIAIAFDGGCDRVRTWEGILIAASNIGLGDIVVYAIAGAIIGGLPRLLVPGKQSMSIAVTIGVGIVAAVIGGYLWNAVFPDNEGIAWIGSVIVAVVLVFLYATLFGSKTRT
jgi:uncharacterized membrane protein YeaQ/YmgE (transglycosylase-associated protein family)